MKHVIALHFTFMVKITPLITTYSLLMEYSMLECKEVFVTATKTGVYKVFHILQCVPNIGTHDHSSPDLHEAGTVCPPEVGHT